MNVEPTCVVGRAPGTMFDKTGYSRTSNILVKVSFGGVFVHFVFVS